MNPPPRPKAVALQYNPHEPAPKVIAKGAGVVAEKIVEKAQEADVAIHQDAELLASLTQMDLGAYIPAELYEVVAQVLVFVSELDKDALDTGEPGLHA